MHRKALGKGLEALIPSSGRARSIAETACERS